MKREEAIKLLNDIHSQCCDTANILCTPDADKRCEALQLAITALQNQPVWIPVSERLPEEHDSIFKKFKGTSKWNPVMFEKTSKYVIATVEYIDGTRLTTRAHTTDGIWKADNSLMTGKVVAWMPMPEPYRESEVENGEMGN